MVTKEGGDNPTSRSEPAFRARYGDTISLGASFAASVFEVRSMGLSPARAGTSDRASGSTGRTTVDVVARGAGHSSGRHMVPCWTCSLSCTVPTLTPTLAPTLTLSLRPRLVLFLVQSLALPLMLVHAVTLAVIVTITLALTQALSLA